MDRDERRDRMQRMRRQVMENNIYRWAANVLGALARNSFGRQRRTGDSGFEPDGCGSLGARAT